MRAPISVVIPTLNSAKALPETLASLTEGLEAGLIRELVISDGGSTDATHQISEAAGAEWITGPTSGGGQLCRGVEASQGAWLLVLHANTHLAPGWADVVLKHLRENPGQAGYFQLTYRARGLAAKLAAGWANWRSRVFSQPLGNQGLLIPRALYDEVGGYSDIPALKDVALARALKTRLVALGAVIVASP